MYPLNLERNVNFIVLPLWIKQGSSRMAKPETNIKEVTKVDVTSRGPGGIESDNN